MPAIQKHVCKDAGAKHEGGEPTKLRGKSTTQATVLAPLDDNLISASVERKYRHPWFI